MILALWFFSLLVAPTSQSPVSGTTTGNGKSGLSAGWQYEQLAGAIHKASLASTNQIQLPFPAKGGSTVTLNIRARAGSSSSAYFSVTNGLLTKSYQGGDAKVRFGSGSNKTYVLTPAANGTGNLVFVDNARQFISQLKAAKSMTVQFTLANQPFPPVQFNTTGLRWTH